MTASAIYWPGTAIPKSRNNAFNWRGQGSEVFAAHPMQFTAGTHSANGRAVLATTEPRLSPAQREAQALAKKPPGMGKNGGRMHGISAKADKLLADRHGGAYSKARKA